MSLKKFGDKDIIINTMRAHPRVEFLIFDSRVFYNGIPEQSGVLSHDYNVPEGHISLYEYNIDRVIDRGTPAKPRQLNQSTHSLPKILLVQVLELPRQRAIAMSLFW